MNDMLQSSQNRIYFGTGASSVKDYTELLNLVRVAIQHNILGFDTAPSYRTEEILGQCLQVCMTDLNIAREELFIQTKVDAWQMVEDKETIKKHITEKIRGMGLTYLDALLIHWPIPEHLDKTWEVMCELQSSGMIQEIGICNVRMRQLKEFTRMKVKPQIIQIELNPLRTCAAEIDFCRENRIKLQAYSPLCKMHTKIKEKTEIQSIADKYGKNVGQVILRWHLQRGVLPIFTSTKEYRVIEYSDIFDFVLSEQEIQVISSLNESYKMYLESIACPGF